MRFGITILPEYSWPEAERRWRRAEDLGFDHAWTYDHLVWGGLPAHPWYGTIPTLAAVAVVTERLRLGTFVSSPNYRHPYVFARDLLALDDISGGRVICGLGTGGDLDSRILGDDLTLRERVDRFHEFVPLLHRLLTEDDVHHEGEHYVTVGARSLPGPVQRPRMPFVVAANGPRSIRLAARHGDGWVTTGRGGGGTLDSWFAHARELGERLDEALAAVGRERGAVDRYLSLDSSPRYSLESVGAFDEMVGRAGEAGFTDVIVHWPRSEGPYAGDEAILDTLDLASRS
jgi:alkanesulfonate monooxygenase SsuD/methylene tetrahydromethanopterin reductase-like flavin-dependent oxidoreductase (luciferase family)